MKEKKVMESSEEIFEEFMQKIREESNLREEALSPLSSLFKELVLPQGQEQKPHKEESVEELIEKAVQKNSQAFTEEEKEKQKQILRDVFIEGKTPAEAFRIGSQELEQLFQEGRRFFQSGQYNKAIDVFEELNALSPYSLPIVFSAAACYHAKKEYERAAGWYYLASKIEPNFPLPLFYLSDCLTHLELVDFAKKTMQKCISLAKKDLAYAEMGERVQLMLKQLEGKTPISPQKTSP